MWCASPIPSENSSRFKLIISTVTKPVNEHMVYHSAIYPIGCIGVWRICRYLKRSAQMFRNCNYCAVCPEKIRIGRIFQLYLQHNIWGLSDAVRKRRDVRSGPWGGDGPFGLAALPEACTECGACLEKCPQKIGIPAELKRVWPVLLEL